MGMLEDLLLGMNVDWGDSDFTGNLREQKLRKLLEEQYNKQQSPLDAAVSSIKDTLSGVEDPFGASAERAGLVDRPSSPTTSIEDIAKGRIEDRVQSEASKAEQVVLAAKEKSDVAKAEQKRQLGSLVSDMPADKLLRIRKQAADRPEGYTGGEGGFTVAPSSPEIDARNAETKQWLGGQAERDLEYAVTPEQARRNPEYAEGAAGNLSRLRAQRDVERRTANQEALVSELETTGGKVPFATAMKMEAAGLQVPTLSIGMSPERAKNDLLKLQQQTMQSIKDVEMSGAPEATVQYLYYIYSSIPEYMAALEKGYDPDRLIAEVTEMVNRHGEQSGARQFALQRKDMMERMTPEVK